MDNDALVQHLLIHREKLLAHVRRKVSSHDLAEDLLQESLLKALRAAPDLRDQERLLPWFYTVLNNAITDSYRRGAVASRVFTPFDPSRHDPPAPDAEEEQYLCECFRALLPTLKPDYAELIESLDLRGEEPAKTAERLGLSSNTLKVRRHRARQALRKRLEETCRTCARHGCLDCHCQRPSAHAEHSTV
jgi:RNA polymerase sigma factor (sigma-70 family)